MSVDGAQTSIDAFDWMTWQPGVRATLMLIRNEDNLLLIDKLTGLGKGKVNAPGGKIEQGESPVECAIRETFEEVGLQVHDAREVAHLRFLMSDYPDIECFAFSALSYSGSASSSQEARPFWCPIAEIPYNKMWADDVLWLPKVLEGRFVRGDFRFEGDRLDSYLLHEERCL